MTRTPRYEMKPSGVNPSPLELSTDSYASPSFSYWAIIALASASALQERERNVLFNDALNTFYLRLYSIRHMVKDHSTYLSCRILASDAALSWIIVACVSAFSFSVLASVNLRGRSWIATCEQNKEGRKEMFYLTMHSTHFIYGYMEGRKEGNVLFNDALNTFYLRLYGVRHMVDDHSDNETARVLLYASSHRQDNTYHGHC